MYYLVYGIFYLLSLLPLRVLYLFSDLAYVLVYYVFGYRKKVVMENLKHAFPEKTDGELKIIAKKFYRRFCDNFIEFIKLLSASVDYINRHFTGDYSLCNKIYEEGRKCELLLAHNFNWEWGDLALGHNIKHDFLGVYMPISNKVFDRLFFKVRSKTGAIMLSATDMRNAMIPYRNRTYMLALVADQNAGNVKQAYWLNFFGRPAPFVKGPERGAKTGNLPVIFCRMIWLKRGYYRIEFEMGEASPAGLAEGALTRKYVDYLEKIIRAQPENWLWSHKRWKHTWKEEYGPVL